MNGVQSTEANHRQAYVEQSDNFYSMLSVAETLTMAAQLQMAPGLPEASKQSYVDNLISVLGLAKVRAARRWRIGGGEHILGLSGKPHVMMLTTACLPAVS